MSKVSRQIDGKLLHLMLNEFSLKDHFLALKKFILLGQGDFVTCLMDEVGPELKRRATQLYRHNLSGWSQTQLIFAVFIYLRMYVCMYVCVVSVLSTPEVFTHISQSS